MLRKKLKEKKGFTLMEMLIVVAIIVILVAISIPVFTNQMNNAKKAVDDANLRAAKSVATSQYLIDGELKINGTTVTTCYYDTENGVLVANAPKDYGQYGKHTVIEVKVESTTGTVSCKWLPEDSE